jgi:CBS domain-containing protein/gamma-glutamylcysteine synthetase
MGENRVNLIEDKAQMQVFMRKLLQDVQAFEQMLEKGWFEYDITRIGAEQEIALVDAETFKPAFVNMEAMESLAQYPWVDTELAKFNLETGFIPRELKNSCLADMEAENREYLGIIEDVLKPLNARYVLTGILPTVRKHDMGMHNLTPKPRYRALMEAIERQLHGSEFELRLVGIDELRLKHDSPLLEAVNTSFQIHMQIAPENFVQMYNIAQVLTAPVLAIAANSPLVFGRRLWHESRIAMFQQALDTRTSSDHMRERSARVHFGSQWLRQSILEIYKEDIARFRVLLGGEVEENALEMVKNGMIPQLRALQIHNSTIYRWNRPCYGISSTGKPHLRIENRVLPSGPTVIDEMANAAFWLGCMVAFSQEYKDITRHISFDDARDNFGKAAQFGIDSKFTWFADEKINCVELVRNRLLPMAKQGLESVNIDSADINKYLSIIEGRAINHMNGARWQLRAYTSLKRDISEDEALTVITNAMIENQDKPVHEWEIPGPSTLKSYKPVNVRVGEFMTTDLFTVQEDDIVNLVEEVMSWRKIRYIPVEDARGKLVGLVTIRRLLNHFVRHRYDPNSAVTVREIMINDPITVSPDTSIGDALELMRERRIGGLPVVQGNELVGIITAMDFLRITGRLLQRLEKQ